MMNIFISHKQGSASMISAVSIALSVAIGFFTIDYGIANYYRNAAQNAADAAILAGLVNMKGDTQTQKTASVREEAIKVFQANTASLSDSITLTDLDVAANADGSYTASASFSVNTLYSHLFTNGTLSNNYKVSSTAAGGSSSTKKLEVAIAWANAENSNVSAEGRLLNNFVSDTKTHISAVLDGVYGTQADKKTESEIITSIIPFADFVKVQPASLSNSWQEFPYDAKAVSKEFDGCVTSRSINYKPATWNAAAVYEIDDAPPSESKLPVVVGPFVSETIANQNRQYYWISPDIITDFNGTPFANGPFPEPSIFYTENISPYSLYYGDIKNMNAPGLFSYNFYIKNAAYEEGLSSLKHENTPGVYILFGLGKMQLDSNKTLLADQWSSNYFKWYPLWLSNRYHGVYEAQRGYTNRNMLNLYIFPYYKKMHTRIYYTARRSSSIPGIEELLTVDDHAANVMTGRYRLSGLLKDSLQDTTQNYPVNGEVQYMQVFEYDGFEYDFHSNSNAPMSIYAIQTTIGCELRPSGFFIDNKKDAMAVVEKFSTKDTDGTQRLPVGLSWAYYSLSSKWRGVLPEFKDKKVSAVYPKDSNASKKVAVLISVPTSMTEFDIQTTRKLCERMKQEDIEIVVIDQGTVMPFEGMNPKNVFSECVSKSENYLYNTPTPEKIKSLFEKIVSEADVTSGTSEGSGSSKVHIIK